MTRPNASNTQAANALRQALGPGFGLAGPSELLLNTVAPVTTVDQPNHRR